MSPHAHVRSLPPEGAPASFEAARQEASPHAHVRSLPQSARRGLFAALGAPASFEAASQEAA